MMRAGGRSRGPTEWGCDPGGAQGARKSGLARDQQRSGRAWAALVAFSAASLAAAGAAVGAETDLFSPLAGVLMNPRCLNCHTATDYPRQGGDRHRHLFLVARGVDDRGAAGKRCNECHQAMNQVNGVPGASGWRLAPLAMAWESQTGEALSAAALCRRLLDRRRNGGRDPEALVAHLDAEPLVLWAWNPSDDVAGTPRSRPSISHEQFMQAARAWVAGGARCPD
jgi:hypothetical protein